MRSTRSVTFDRDMRIDIDDLGQIEGTGFVVSLERRSQGHFLERKAVQ